MVAREWFDGKAARRWRQVEVETWKTRTGKGDAWRARRMVELFFLSYPSLPVLASPQANEVT